MIQNKMEHGLSQTISEDSGVKLPSLMCGSGDFNPPILGTPAEFCKEVIAKRLPIQECLQLAPPPEVKVLESEDVLPTHKSLKNWQRWCRIWKRNQSQLSQARQGTNKPPLMTSGEGFWYKREDTELFERTLQLNNLTGYVGTLEQLSPKQDKNHSEIKRYRYPRRVRDELGLNIRCTSTSLPPVCRQEDHSIEAEESQVLPSGPTGRCVNWENQWRDSTAFASNYWLRWDHPENAGFLDPYPNDLILQAPEFGIGDPRPQEKRPLEIPELKISDAGLSESRANSAQILHYQNDNDRGPILQVRGRRADIQLSFVPNDLNDEVIFEGDQYFCEELDMFSATTKGKEIRHITLKNEGTTLLRYQWLRNPPNKETEQLLSNPAGSVVEGGDLTNLLKTGLKPGQVDEKVFKPSCLEFRFRELPRILLPGQSLEFPIIFRSQKPGYFYETLYLAIHPKLRDKEGRSYSMRLTGICMDPDVDADNNPRVEDVNQLLKQTAVEQEAMDLMDSVLDQVLFTDPNSPSTCLKSTSELISCGVSQKSLETVRKLLEDYVRELLALNEAC